MKTLRTLLLIAFAAAMLGTLVDTGTEATAMPHSVPNVHFAGDDRAKPFDLQTYIDNKEVIDKIWIELGDDATLRDAVDEFNRVRSEAEDSPTDARPAATQATLASCPGGVCRVSATRSTNHSDSVSRHTSTNRGYATVRGDRRFGWRIRAVGRFIFCRRR